MAALALAHDDLAIAIKDEDSDADLWAGIHVGGVSGGVKNTPQNTKGRASDSLLRGRLCERDHVNTQISEDFWECFSHTSPVSS